MGAGVLAAMVMDNSEALTETAGSNITVAVWNAVAFAETEALRNVKENPLPSTS